MWSHPSNKHIKDRIHTEIWHINLNNPCFVSGNLNQSYISYLSSILSINSPQHPLAMSQTRGQTLSLTVDMSPVAADWLSLSLCGVYRCMEMGDLYFFQLRIGKMVTLCQLPNVNTYNILYVCHFILGTEQNI